jgi:hypothetical protein
VSGVKVKYRVVGNCRVSGVKVRFGVVWFLGNVKLW